MIYIILIIIFVSNSLAFVHRALYSSLRVSFKAAGTQSNTQTHHTIVSNNTWPQEHRSTPFQNRSTSKSDHSIWRYDILIFFHFYKNLIIYTLSSHTEQSSPSLKGILKFHLETTITTKRRFFIFSMKKNSNLNILTLQYTRWTILSFLKRNKQKFFVFALETTIYKRRFQTGREKCGTFTGSET